jgi:ABC-type Fe3+/spermidine/putrescine transport system ATPase subunit
MGSIELRGIDNFICRDVSFNVREGELFVLLGPTGAGKTTILNVIAGLVDYDGSVLLGGRPIDGIPTSQRGVGYLFQDLALFPHLNVSTNIEYGLKATKHPGPERKARVRDLLGMMKVEHLATRFPRDLSGGERQRVALARALAPFPDVLLLDEPLSSLDFGTSRYLQMEFQRLQKEMAITTIYVTHNQREAEEIADRMAIMDQGTVHQVGMPDEIFFNPRNGRVSEFLGSPNILPCESCQDLGHGLFEIHTGDLTIVVPHDGPEIEKISIIPRDIHVSRGSPPGPALNRFKGIVTHIIPSGISTRVVLRVGIHRLIAEIPPEASEVLGLSIGMEVFVKLKLKRIRTLPNVA